MAEAGRCNPINLEEEELTQFKASLSMIMLFRHEAQRDTYGLYYNQDKGSCKTRLALVSQTRQVPAVVSPATEQASPWP